MTDTSSTNTIPVDDIVVGSRILYPHQVRKGSCEDRPVVVSGIVEYPANRVLYFAEGGMGVIDRRVSVKTAAR